MDAKHTPGPWQCYVDLPSVESNWHIVTNASRMRVLANVHIEPGNTMDAANAALITAAPDLLSALKDLIEASDDDAVDDCEDDGHVAALDRAISALEAAQKAIAKAERGS